MSAQGSDMTPISSNHDEFPLRLSVRQQFLTHDHESLGEILSMTRERMARQLVQEIVRHQKMFSLDVKDSYGTQRADIIVMTEHEYHELMRKKFMEGLQHAQGFMPTWEKT